MRYKQLQAIKILQCYFEKGEKPIGMWPNGKPKDRSQLKSSTQLLEDGNYSVKVDKIQRNAADKLSVLLDVIEDKKKFIEEWKRESGYNRIKKQLEHREKYKLGEVAYSQGSGNAIKISKEDRIKFKKLEAKLNQFTQHIENLTTKFRNETQKQISFMNSIDE